jgi:hypothetical protein
MQTLEQDFQAVRTYLDRAARQPAPVPAVAAGGADPDHQLNLFG